MNLFDFSCLNKNLIPKTILEVIPNQKEYRIIYEQSEVLNTIVTKQFPINYIKGNFFGCRVKTKRFIVFYDIEVANMKEVFVSPSKDNFLEDCILLCICVYQEWDGRRICFLKKGLKYRDINDIDINISDNIADSFIIYLKELEKKGIVYLIGYNSSSTICGYYDHVSVHSRGYDLPALLKASTHEIPLIKNSLVGSRYYKCISCVLNNVICYDVLPYIDVCFKDNSMESEYRNLINSNGNSLNSWSKYLLNKNKIPFDSFVEVALKKVESTDLIRYCMNDVILTREIFYHNTINGIHNIDTYCSTFMISPYMAMYQKPSSIVSHILKMYRMYSVYEDNKIEIPKVTAEGGIVEDPPKGLKEVNVYLDFNSLYPSVIREYNICFTTYRYKKNEELYKCFVDRKDRIGLLTTMMDTFVDMREKSNGFKKKIIKTILLSTYGLFLSRQFEYKNVTIASAILEAARKAYTDLRNILISMRATPIYGDTDSFIGYIKNVDSDNIHTIVNGKLKYMYCKVKNEYPENHFFFTGMKKHYICVLNRKLHVKGLKISNICKKFVDIQYKYLFEKILEYDFKSNIIDPYLKVLRKEFDKGNIFEISIANSKFKNRLVGNYTIGNEIHYIRVSKDRFYQIKNINNFLHVLDENNCYKKISLGEYANAYNNVLSNAFVYFGIKNIDINSTGNDIENIFYNTKI